MDARHDLEPVSPTRDKIIAMRQAAGMSTKEAAALVGMAVRAWQRWESGDRQMHVSDWNLFCSRLRCLLISRSVLLGPNGVNGAGMACVFDGGNPFVRDDAVFRHIGMEGLSMFDTHSVQSIQMVETVGTAPAIAYTPPDPPMPFRLGLAMIAARTGGLVGETDLGAPIIRAGNQTATIDSPWLASAFLKCLIRVLLDGLQRAQRGSGSFLLKLSMTTGRVYVVGIDCSFDDAIREYHVHISVTDAT